MTFECLTWRQPIISHIITKCIETTLGAENITVPCEINVMVTDDKGIHAVNLASRQIDLPDDKTSGLKDAVRVLDGIKDIAICRLTAADVVRHALVQEIINAYEKASQKPDFKKPNPNFKGHYKRKN